MKKRTKQISVCIATYNGERFLRMQLDSIVAQMIDGDELIIVDDHSSDSTVEIIKSYCSVVKIKIVINEENKGVNKSFEVCIANASNEIILLADQDDIWPVDRVAIMVDALADDKVKLVSGNSCYVDAVGDPIDFPAIPLKSSESKKLLINTARILMGQGAYFGCAMAFKKTLNNIILPFPDYIESHDLWIAQAAIISNESLHIESIVLLRRVHGNNASIINRPLIEKLFSRAVFIGSILHIAFRLLIKRNKQR